MQSLDNPRTYLISIILLIIGLCIAIVGLLQLVPSIDYPEVTNSTTSGVYKLEFSSIPSIINGLTSATSIIVGFTGALVGIVQGLFIKNKNEKYLLLQLLGIVLIPLILLFAVYFILIMGLTDIAIKLSIFTLVYSFFILALVFYSSLYRLARKENQTQTINPSETETVSDEVENEESNNQETRTMSPEEENERNELIYDTIINRYEQEWDRTNDLDSKASNVTGFAGLLATLTGSINEFFPDCNYPWLFLIPLGLFILSAIFGLWAYWTQTFRVINPQNVITGYSNRTKRELLMAITATTSEHTLYNYSLNETKVKRIRYSFGVLVFAIFLFLIFAIINLLM